MINQEKLEQYLAILWRDCVRSTDDAKTNNETQYRSGKERMVRDIYAAVKEGKFNG